MLYMVCIVSVLHVLYYHFTRHVRHGSGHFLGKDDRAATEQSSSTLIYLSMLKPIFNQSSEGLVDNVQYTVYMPWGLGLKKLILYYTFKDKI